MSSAGRPLSTNAADAVRNKIPQSPLSRDAVVCLLDTAWEQTRLASSESQDAAYTPQSSGPLQSWPAAQCYPAAESSRSMAL